MDIVKYIQEKLLKNEDREVLELFFDDVDSWNENYTEEIIGEDVNE